MSVGIGMTFGMDIRYAEGATGSYLTNLSSKGRTICENIKKEEYGFGFMHIKAVDDAAHDKDSDIKKEFFLKIDIMLKEMIEDLTEDEKHNKKKIFVVTGDHSSPVVLGDHSFEPVPFSISSLDSIVTHLNQEEPSTKRSINLKKLRDTVTKFEEVETGTGILGRFQGNQIMEVIKRFKNSCSTIVNSEF